MAVRKLKPIEERDPYAAAVLDAFDKLETVREPSLAAANEIEKLRELLRRGMRQLALWHEKYGDNGPDWIPPAGDVRWLEDACDALKTPNVKLCGERSESERT